MRFTTVPIASVARERNSWARLATELHGLPHDRALAVQLEEKTYAAVMSAAHNRARQLGLKIETRYDKNAKQMFIWKAAQNHEAEALGDVGQQSNEPDYVGARSARTKKQHQREDKAPPGVGEDIRRVVCKHPDWPAETVKEAVEKILGVGVKENTFNINYFGAKATIKTAKALGYWKGPGSVSHRVHATASAMRPAAAPPPKRAEATGNSKPRRFNRATPGTVKTTRFFYPYILDVLLNAPGDSLRTGQALKQIEQRVNLKLNDKDRESLATGAVRWINRCQWARDEMVKAGLLHSKEVAGRGVWKLTEEGKKYQLEDR